MLAGTGLEVAAMNDHKMLCMIGAKIGLAEALAQLSEESAELAEAALKLRRAMGTKNPTPVTVEEARDNLLEEIADVSNCIIALGLDTGIDRLYVQGVMSRKTRRWAVRLGLMEDEEGGISDGEAKCSSPADAGTQRNPAAGV